MRFSFGQHLRKYTLVAVTALFLVSTFLRPVAANAQVGMLTFDTGLNAAQIQLGFKEALFSGVVGGAVNFISYFTRKLAYDAALFLSTGDKGQRELIYKGGFNKYIGDVVTDSAATFVGEFGKPFGLNLCEIPDLQIQSFLQISLGGLFGVHEPTPTCTFQQLRDGWSNEAFEQQYGPGASQFLARSFSQSIDVNNTDFGIALGAVSKIDGLTAGAAAGASSDRIEGQGFKPVTDLITGNIVTPAESVRRQVAALDPQERAKVDIDQLDNLYQKELTGILPAAGKVFLGTLTSNLLNQFVDGLFPDKPKPGEQRVEGAIDFFAGELQQNKVAAENAFAFLFTGLPTRQENYDIVGQFVTCPTTNPGINNCVMDRGLQQAVDRAAAGDSITIAQALEQDLLHPDWFIISPRRETDNVIDVENTRGSCHERAYCFSNLQKLRKARILPIGFEIAASKSDPDHPEQWTLGRVVDGFYDCDYAFDDDGNPVVQNNPEKPFCNLINPNWVIEAPQARCEAEVFTDQLLDRELADRQRSCVDVSTCVATNEQGECISYGYCTKEENVWKLGVDSCPAHAATCTTFRNTQTGAVASYLSRTVDFAECNEDTVGCRAYSTEQGQDDWVASPATQLALKAVGRNQVIHFNQRIGTQTCPASEDGCSAFFTAEKDPFIDQYRRRDDGKYHLDDNRLVYLKKAPDYLGCYDRDPNTPAIEWPETVSQVENNVQGAAACGDFAQVCVESEVGCELFTPEAGGPSVPGIIGTQICNEECVGYQTFRQLGFEDVAVNGQGFEGERSPLYFIPPANNPNAEECSAAFVGCDEFTNIDDRGDGGERLEYYSKIRSCVEPDSNVEKVYYTWEGSAQDGFVLQTHSLVRIDTDQFNYLQRIDPQFVLPDDSIEPLREVFGIGAPAVADDRKRTLEEHYGVCNRVLYENLVNGLDGPKADPDCRAFFDTNGEIFYRLLEDTVVVSDECRTLRKTDSYLVYDEDLTTAGLALCEARGGLWGALPFGEEIDDAPGQVCRTCAGGGNYVNGTCVYEALVSESLSCPAAANACRAYVGNTGNNRSEIFGIAGDTFEPTSENPDALFLAREDWFPRNGVDIAAEALQVGQHSLELRVEDTRRLIPAGVLEPGDFYELTFWARGGAQNLEIRFEEDNNTRFLLESILYNLRDKYVSAYNAIAGGYCAVDLPEDLDLLVQTNEAQIIDLIADAQGEFDRAQQLIRDNLDIRVDIVTLMQEFNGFIRDAQAAVDRSRDDWLALCGEDPLTVEGEAPDLEATLFRDTRALRSFTFDPFTDTNIQLSVGTTWQEYRLGPIEFTGNDEHLAALLFTQIITDNNNDVPLYLDNVQLTRVQDTVYLIRDSWQTAEGLDAPRSCFSDNQDPASGVPGAALGCRAYADSDGDPHYATAFDALCREAAVGCAPVYDTYNTLEDEISERSQLFAVRCELTGNEETRNICATVVDGVPYSCTVQAGQDHCFIEDAIVIAEDQVIDYADTGEILTSEGRALPSSRLFVVDSTVVVPADTPSTTPIFLTDTREYRCAEEHLGCQQVGLEQHVVPTDDNSSFDFEERYVLNQPDRYLGDDGTLCRDDLLGCTQFDAGTDVFFFRDPAITGQAFCEYKPRRTDGNGNSENYGWFMKDIGRCSHDADVLCRNNSQCDDGDDDTSESCTGIGTVACYDNFVQQGGEYGIWSNETENYEGFVGVCEAEHNRCTELVDVADSSQYHPEGEPYYVIFNDRITDRIGECQGQVSLEEGCVLFDKTDEPNKLYDSRVTYQKSRTDDPERPYELVTPESTARNNTNIILKVDRGRECSEWLACKTALPQRGLDGSVQELCYEYRGCSEVDPTSGQCIRWVNTLEDPLTYTTLTEDVYTARPNGWYDVEYSGYTLFNKYQIQNYTYLTFDKEESGFDDQDFVDTNAQFIAYEAPAPLFTTVDGEINEFADDGCLLDNGETKDNWLACGIDSGGRCYNGKCIYPLDGPYLDSVDANSPPRVRINQALESGICKGYPEKDSPIQSYLAYSEDEDRVQKRHHEDNVSRFEYPNRPNQYRGANVCQSGGEGCACEYQRVEYGNGTVDYWNLGTANVADGICEGGDREGNPCSVDLDCQVVDENDTIVSEGSCTTVKQKSQHIGLRGFCLEYDLSRPIDIDKGLFACQTWLPIDTSASNVDIYNTDESAGYVPGTDARVSETLVGGQAYCVDATSVNGGEWYSEMASADVFFPAVDNFNARFISDYNYEQQDSPLLVERAQVYVTPFLPKWLCQADGEPIVGGNGRINCNQTNDLNRFGYDCRATPRFDDVTFIPSDYANVHCLPEGEDATNGQYSQLQAWAWGVSDYKQLDTYPVVLRLDTYAPRALPGDDNSMSDIGGAPVSHGFAEKALPIHLGNVNFVDTTPCVPENGGENYPSCKVVKMHPPLPWASNGELITSFSEETNTERLYYYDWNASGDRDFSPLTHAPGRLLGEAHGEDQHKIWRNPAESSIKEADISRVHFVPLSYTGVGASDRNPALGSDLLYIDFDDLRTNENGYSSPRSVPVTNDQNFDFDKTFEFPVHATLGKVATYVVTRGEGNDDLLSHINYEPEDYIRADYTAGGALLENFATHEKNRIHRRYVMAFWAGDDDYFADDTGRPQRDVFSGDHFDRPGGRNYLGIAMDFNEDGDFLGYNSVWVTQPERAEGANIYHANGIKFGTVAFLHNRCTAFSAVHDPDPEEGPIAGTKNKAWTNRVWEGANQILEDRNFVSDDWQKNNPLLPPFGSTAFEYNDIQTSNDDLKLYQFDDAEEKGIPYACRTRWFGDNTLSISKICQGIISQGGYDETITRRINSADGINSLQFLFAEVFNRVSLDPQTNTLTLDGRNELGPVRLDVSDVEDRPELITPQIYSLNPVTCSDTTVPCTVGERNNFTVNGKNGTLADYDGDAGGAPFPAGADEDLSRDGQPDAIVASGSTRAIVRFFAWADDDRMPIRRVMVDWGDGSNITNEGRKGLYKNRKPFCGPEVGKCFDGDDVVEGLTCSAEGADQECPGDLTCELSEAKFGDQDRACKPDYFEFVHDYVCGPGEISDQNEKVVKRRVIDFADQDTRIRLRNQGLADGDKVCVFKPKVQVLDNWGWCNGSVAVDRTLDGETIYEALEVGNHESDNDSCESDSLTGWTHYQGYIVVTPQDF